MVNLVPMTEEIIIPDQTVLVHGTRIAAIDPSNRIKIPETQLPLPRAYQRASLISRHGSTALAYERGECVHDFFQNDLNNR